ncbi:uncharacterized protein PRCAT00003378001 [Priceomyces carsonii]|uniref:uncharacterized protein n=1 Tax=Priceomyces carsonii TaxID=28549 RepID=UPI002ED95049|nr:unnamed protein product [Priceomyces carsonii]
MLGPSTSSERSTVNADGQLQGHPDGNGLLVGRQADYQNATATAAAAVSASGYGAGHPDDPSHFHHQHGYHSASASAAAAAAAAAQLQHQQQQLQQQHQLHQQFQQFPQQQVSQHQHQLPPHHAPHQFTHAPSSADYEPTGILHSKYMENEVIKTFPSKQDLVKYVKNVLNDEEQCKIVINSSKPKAVYFQCERSGLFRTTVKDSTKRQRVAYTKRNKCGYRLIANLYPSEKDKKRVKGSVSPDGNLDEKLNEFQSHSGSLDQSTGERWVLRMINPAHNHPPEPSGGKKKRLKFSRTLVEKPLNRTNNTNNAFNTNVMVNPLPPHVPHSLVQQAHQQGSHLHNDDPNHHTPSVQDAAVIAAIEATPAAAVALHNQNAHVDPNIDPNVDPSVQEHDHSHGNLR